MLHLCSYKRPSHISGFLGTRLQLKPRLNGVWSEDGDALAFGCQTLIKSYFKIRSSTENREDKRKSFTHFKVYRLDDLARQYPGMDRKGFILYAILNGRPNDVRELYNLTPQDVLNAAGHDLGRSLMGNNRFCWLSERGWQ